jgi:membrane associated rhomboid family serine protease
MGLEEYKRDIAAGRTVLIAEPNEKMRKKFNANIFDIFSHNYSYLLLFLISISFFLQLVIPRPYYTELLILDPPLVMERPWTLVTHIFLHGGFEHFFFNMLFFIFFGPLLERKIGSTKFLLIFFLSGIFAGIGWSLTSAYPALGASGALMGIFATLAVLMPRMRVYFFFLIPMEIWMVVVLFALFDFIILGSGDMIAHTAHLSGLFFGLVAGMWLKKTF